MKDRKSMRLLPATLAALLWTTVARSPAQAGPEAAIEQARAEVIAGTATEAITAMQRLLATADARHDAWSVLAWANLRAGRLEEAETAIAKALLRAAPAARPPLELLAGEIQDRFARLEKLREATAAQRSGRYQEAAEDLAAAWRLDPLDYQILVNALEMYQLAEQLEPRVVLLREFQESVPEIHIGQQPVLQKAAERTAAEVRVAVGEQVAAARSAIQRGEHAEAERVLMQAQGLDPDNAAVHGLLAEVNKLMGRKPPPVRYGGRGGGRMLGAKNVVTQTIERGLGWLQRHQAADGRFSSAHFADCCKTPRCNGAGAPVRDVWTTSLALLAFLGDGNTIRGRGDDGIIRRGVAWLCAQQDDEGILGARDHDAWFHDHVLATWALVEACGLSGSAALRPSVRRALAAVRARQLPTSPWPQRPGGAGPDLGVSCAAALAIHAGTFFELIDAAPERDGLLLAWLDQSTDAGDGMVRAAAIGSDPGMPPNDRPGATGLALLTRFFLRQDPKRAPVMARSATAMTAAGMPAEPTALLYETMALYQTGGKSWTGWWPTQEAWCKRQSTEGCAAGSWDPGAAAGGRIQSTATLVLTLETFYRYTRVRR